MTKIEQRLHHVMTAVRAAKHDPEVENETAARALEELHQSASESGHPKKEKILAAVQRAITEWEAGNISGTLQHLSSAIFAASTA